MRRYFIPWDPVRPSAQFSFFRLLFDRGLWFEEAHSIPLSWQKNEGNYDTGAKLVFSQWTCRKCDKFVQIFFSLDTIIFWFFLSDFPVLLFSCGLFLVVINRHRPSFIADDHPRALAGSALQDVVHLAKFTRSAMTMNYHKCSSSWIWLRKLYNISR